MSDSRSKHERLPIKVVMPKQGQERKIPGGGGGINPFRTVDDNYRSSLAKQVEAIGSILKTQAQRSAGAPVRVKLLPKACAKSHRPDNLFSDKTCPIIGVGHLGELFIRATSEGIERLTHEVTSNKSDRIVKELSTIESIEPVTPGYRRGGRDSADILRKSPKWQDGFVSRVRLFNWGENDAQQALVQDFENTCKRHGIRITTSGYSVSSFNYRVECSTVDGIETLSKVMGVRSISSMPLISLVRPRAVNFKPLPKVVRRGDVAGDVPVVVVVDSGIATDLADLEPWVVGRASDVAPAYRNTDHGTFVAGLICWGRELNPTVAGIDEAPCAVFDLQVIPNHDPERGEISSLLENEFLQSLDTALQEHANKFKVWNLSLGTDAVCLLHEFSPLAEQLDNLQEKYQVSFVISAGNYDTPPLMSYPRTTQQIEVGRITAPADSVLGITVGSVSHVDYKSDGPRQNDPSPYSRHGAGPNYIIKPDLVHFGGSCSHDLSHVSGIRSVFGDRTAEDLGTSFAAPLVSRTLAQIYHQITPTPSPVLARALLTHHARDPRSGRRVPDGDENYFGFGLPAPVPSCLECSTHSSTLIFDDVLRPGYYLEWKDFPYPPSLYRGGRYFGEIWMTVAFAPARGSRWGSEYCETHIDAHFGVYRGQKSRATGIVKPKFIGLVPPEHKNPGVLYESYQVEKLRKWAPVRTYHGLLGDKGERGDSWRLALRLLTRHGVDDQAAFNPQPFSLIITICDPHKTAPVYDEMAQIVRNRFQAQNLTIRSGVRVQSQV